MKIHRLLGITYYMLNHKRSTAEELSSKFQVSKRTIYRDIELLSESGLPLYTTQGSGGGIYLMDSYRMDCSTLTESELKQVLEVMEGVRSVDLGDSISSVVDKLAAGYRQRDQRRTVAMDFSPMDWMVPGDMERKWHTLHHAILDQKAVSLVYVNKQGIKSERIVEPMTLLFRTASWYLYGYCRERSDYRLFKLSRMVTISVLEQGFERKGREWEHGFFSSGGEDDGWVELRVRMAAGAAGRAIDTFHIDNITFLENGTLEAVVTWPKEYSLVNNLLQFGADIEVLEPQWLRDKLAQRAERIAKTHRN